MGMTKHGNTFAPGDRVILAQAGTKVAGSSGKVIDIDPSMEMARIDWGNGDISFEELHKLAHHGD
jgi:hypothetical protein